MRNFLENSRNAVLYDIHNMQTNSSNNTLYEVIHVRLFLILALVFYHAFAIFSGAWEPIDGYPNVQVYNIMDELSYACLLETFVFISGYILGYQVRKKGEEYIQTRGFIIKKIKRLLVPSILFSVLYILLFGKGDRSALSTLYEVCSGAGHMWFLPMLFWCFLLVYIFKRLKVSNGILLIITPLLICLSAIPLPFRLGSAMYYFPFFWGGYCVKKYNLNWSYKVRTLFPIIAACFVLAFILKLNLDAFYIVGGGNVVKIINVMMSLFCRFVCAVLGIYLLMIAALKFANARQLLKSSAFITLSDCCFGVYIFQQFVLVFIERTELPSNISPYIYPWMCFLIALITSLVLTILVRKTKIGLKIL